MADGFPFLDVSPSTISQSDKEAIAAAIDAEELVKLALDLGNVPSFAGQETAAAEFVFEWMKREGFNPRKVGATPERPNVIGAYGGAGAGKNLLFTAHLDTESPTWDPDLDAFKFRPETLDNPEWTQCWLEDGRLHGFPIANDRGPMSCFLMAAKALKKAGIELGGRMYLTACQARSVQSRSRSIPASPTWVRTSEPTTSSITAASRPITQSPPRDVISD